MSVWSPANSEFFDSPLFILLFLDIVQGYLWTVIGTCMMDPTFCFTIFGSLKYMMRRSVSPLFHAFEVEMHHS
ncbi:hypothetical protein BGW36DRAFT_117240 [Talaromyces proteolyticus]|uniref:Uncharacterized protein n=1 Tax=Talaromyces proteolyticus TaxID=1131652 RepID=A0AAD4Q496_9EURO|nr:uncharacterized protein BGW36DRAFT_117240 [Talaromyces proteolyticus]KAH8702457.1 hypothetical protein BGW36DRAFT_117240 [Talaromyces proteolyticus]